MNDKPVPSLLATLLERLQGRENLELEFKSARGGLPKSLWATVSAFANTQGGWLLLGVDEREDALVIEGVRNAAALVQELHDQIRNAQKISYPVCGGEDVSIEPLGDDRQVIVVRVPAASRRIRPVYINGNPYLGTYLRRHAGDYRCTKPEVDRMMREASDISADSTVISGLGLDDLDRQALARFRRRYQTLNTTSPWNDYGDRRFLAAIGGFRTDRERGITGVTVAGLLLLGTPEAIRDWRSRHLIDYRRISGDGGADARWDDRVVWEGNLLGAFDAIYPRLVEGQAVPFKLEGGTRVDEGPAQVALREALVNLLVHADYAETQASLIIRSTDGYTFRNPGSSRVTESDLLTGDRSDPRNPELVRMFRMVGLAEEAGTGIPKIIKNWRELGFRLPSIDVGTERYEFTLSLRHAHLLGDEDRAWLASLGDGWAEAEQLALVCARHEGAVDNLRLRGLTGLHSADVTKVLGSLRDRGLLQMIGGGRTAWYRLGPATPERLGQFFAPSGAGESEGSADPIIASARSPVGMGRSMQGSEPVSEGLASSSEDLGSSPEDFALSCEDLEPSFEGLRPRLEETARLARERPYLDVSTRDAIIVQLCSIVPLSIRQLAELLGRSDPHVREAIRPLIRSGRISYLYPGRPSHPAQKYVAQSSGSPSRSPRDVGRA
jgi:ATP-dependent DNA helicase RecG